MANEAFYSAMCGTRAVNAFKQSPDIDIMGSRLGQRRRRWPSIEQTQSQDRWFARFKTAYK